jgi:cytochrome c peroxidase
MRLRSGARGLIACGLAVGVMSVAAWAQEGAPPSSLKVIPVPRPPDLDRYVRDEQALVVLGKALFWDMQLSSDNRVACASCHFHAGADHRRQNQLSSTNDPVQLNWTLVAGDFPFARGLVEAGHRTGSAGMFPRDFVAVGHAGAPDSGSDLGGEAFPNVHGVNLRQVTTRNAPSVINSVYTYRNFWDGRASDIFTGWTPFGDSDTRANVVVDTDGGLVAGKLHIEQASLASQALGPPLDAGEMSYRGRTWPWLGSKMVDARPLALQAVAPDDGVLGPYASTTGRGFAEEHTYRSLIHAAFQPEYWRSSSLVDEAGVAVAAGSNTAAFEQTEYNFPLFFGLAIQAYESTLISDDSPYDRYLDGKTEALSNVELTGLEMFQRRRCASCHVDPELTLATYSGVFGNFGFPGMGPDAGFFNNGVEPSDNDVGIGGEDPFGQPFARTARSGEFAVSAWRGAFKTPTLRNVEFTGPYVHTGSKSTLEQIVDFYTSGGDYFAPALRRWSPDARERVAMPAFMKAFTDDRVRFERAPFDHPELCVSIGHVEDDQAGVAPRMPSGRVAVERWASIPPVGAQGNSAPLQTFEELLLEVGHDGSRAHTLMEPCSILEIDPVTGP